MSIAVSKKITPAQLGLMVNEANQLVHLASGKLVYQFEIESTRRGPMAFTADTTGLLAMQMIEYGDHGTFIRLNDGDRINITHLF